MDSLDIVEELRRSVIVLAYHELCFQNCTLLDQTPDHVLDSSGAPPHRRECFPNVIPDILILLFGQHR